MFIQQSKLFTKTTNPNPNQTQSLPLNIIFNSESYKCLFYYSNETTQMIFESKSMRYLLDPTCKMIPFFVGQGNSTIVKQIKIMNNEKNQNTQHCVFSSVNLDDPHNFSNNQIIYEKLKRHISHSGFNDFYKPLKRLGRGTFATVYLIEQKFTKQKKAAKVFSYEGQKLQFKGKQALENEIKTLKEIDHPNLIRFDGIYETDNLLYLVTEYLSGGTLEQMMKNKCVHTGQFVSRIIKDILQGLGYLDKKHIMHRDLKPQNIIYRKQDQKWVIGDFGLAAKSNQDYIYNKCGTMGYIAPEIMEINEENPKKYSQSCDIYSLGIIAYTLIIGSLPFHVESENLYDKKIVWDLFDKPQCQQINVEVIDFLKKLLSNDPIKRYTAEMALKSSFFTDKFVVEGLYAYHERRRQERYERILKIANIQY